MTQNVQLGIDFSNDPLLQGPQLFLSRHPRRWKALRLAETIAVSPSKSHAQTWQASMKVDEEVKNFKAES